MTRVAFYAHLWLGVIFTTALVVISVTGILLNHKRGLGLMPDVPHEAERPFTESLPLARVADIALDTVARAAGGDGEAFDPVAGIDRMDVRPRNGFVKVRMRDAGSAEVTLDADRHAGAERSGVRSLATSWLCRSRSWPP